MFPEISSIDGWTSNRILGDFVNSFVLMKHYNNATSYGSSNNGVTGCKCITSLLHFSHHFNKKWSHQCIQRDHVHWLWHHCAIHMNCICTSMSIDIVLRNAVQQESLIGFITSSKIHRVFPSIIFCTNLAHILPLISIIQRGNNYLYSKMHIKAETGLHIERNIFHWSISWFCSALSGSWLFHSLLFFFPIFTSFVFSCCFQRRSTAWKVNEVSVSMCLFHQT